MFHLNNYREQETTGNIPDTEISVLLRAARIIDYSAKLKLGYGFDYKLDRHKYEVP